MPWLLLLLLLTGSAGAQPCPGDCDGNGTVEIAELITGVRVAQGDVDLQECPAFDVTPDGVLRIDELVLGVLSTLAGCPATPTASPSPNSTPTVTETPTPTPTIPPVAGRWREEVLEVTTSTCFPVLTSEFAAQLAARGPCEQLVTMTGETAVQVRDCADQVTDGSIERDGTIHLVFPPAANTVEGCTVTLTTRATIPAATSPTTASYLFQLAFSGTCPLANCAIDATGAWTRLE
jgi:hypothetical protein